MNIVEFFNATTHCKKGPECPGCRTVISVLEGHKDGVTGLDVLMALGKDEEATPEFEAAMRENIRISTGLARAAMVILCFAASQTPDAEGNTMVARDALTDLVSQVLTRAAKQAGINMMHVTLSGQLPAGLFHNAPQAGNAAGPEPQQEATWEGEGGAPTPVPPRV